MTSNWPCSNNDKTVTIYSLTRAKVLKVLPHKACMNYAIISPDSKLLAAVGDEPRAYFYEITRDFESTVLTEHGEKLTGWDWNLIRCVEMDIGTRFDEGCCFTIAFSPTSRLCAIGSQSGIITIFNVATIYNVPSEPNDKNTVICHFRSSRSYYHGGAVRCMSFSPEPWDLLVWIEDHGRAGVVDVRQAFLRRQIVDLDLNEPGLQQVRTEPIPDTSLAFDFDSQYPEPFPERDPSQRAMLDPDDDSINEQGREGGDRLALHESMIQDLTERERLIVEFLNTARWTSRLEDGLTERPGRTSLHPHHATHPRLPGSTDGASRVSRPTSPMRYDALHDFVRESYLGRLGNANRNRRPNSVVLSRGTSGDNRTETGASNAETQPSITLSWTASPSELQSTSSENPSRGSDPTPSDPSIPSNEVGISPRPPETAGRQTTNLDPSSNTPDVIARRRVQRSSSIPRRSERPEATSENRYDPPRLLNSEMRANVAAERLRRQRLPPNHEVHTRTSPWEQRYRQQLLGFEQTRSPRWIRNILNDLPDRSLAAEHRDQEPDGTAGIGWGADGRAL